MEREKQRTGEAGRDRVSFYEVISSSWGRGRFWRNPENGKDQPWLRERGER